MDSLTENYNRLLAAVFIQAFDDLVHAYKGIRYYWQSGSQRQRYKSDAAYLESWIRDAAPQWISIDPDFIIQQARKKAGK